MDKVAPREVGVHGICPLQPSTLDSHRAATNVRTFEYYSFEIFTKELFLRTNVRLRPLVYFWLNIAERSFGLACGAMHAWHYS